MNISEVVRCRQVNPIMLEALGTRNNKAVVFIDIDGVMADCSHRLPYLEKEDYDKFYGIAMASDSVHVDWPITEMMLRGIVASHDEIIVKFLTGRPKSTEQICKLWIRDHIPFFRCCLNDSTSMLMRKDGDKRVAFRVKWELMEEYLEKGEVDDDDESYTPCDFYMIDDDYRNIAYCHDRMHERFNERLFGVVVGANRLPSPTAVTTTELGKR